MRLPSAAATALLLAAAPALARDVPVSTTDELAAAIAAAAPGDVILLADGDYASGNLTCDADGTTADPIVVRAVTPLAAHIAFSGVEGFRVSGAHWHFEGLDLRGVCAADDDCEHAFHVTGNADGFVMRDCRVRDFNAQLKVNAAMVGGAWQTPDGGLIERCELADTRGRDTGNPVTKLNIDTGDDWVVRGNYIHDHHKLGGDGVSYAAFFKSGGARGTFERNLVICSLDDRTGGTRIGLSLGGGGTAPEFCAPAFDAATPCAVEHDGGLLRNNVIAGCSDVGIYLNRARDTRVLHNTLVATAGVDFRFDTTTGEAAGNVLAGRIRARDGATFDAADNVEQVTEEVFAAWYVSPETGDLTAAGDLSTLIGGAPARADVPDDYCGRARPAGMITLGALEHSLGDCATVVPPAIDAGPGGADAAGGPVVDAAPGAAADAETAADGGSGGCDCRTDGRAGGSGAAWLLLALAALRRRRPPARAVAQNRPITP